MYELVSVNDDETTWRYHIMRMHDSDSWKKDDREPEKNSQVVSYRFNVKIEAEIPKVECKFFHLKTNLKFISRVNYIRI